jgi:hypothetical protein
VCIEIKEAEGLINRTKTRAKILALVELAQIAGTAVENSMLRFSCIKQNAELKYDAGGEGINL